jgi:hypothetical protein
VTVGYFKAVYRDFRGQVDEIHILFVSGSQPEYQLGRYLMRIKHITAVSIHSVTFILVARYFMLEHIHTSLYPILSQLNQVHIHRTYFANLSFPVIHVSAFQRPPNNNLHASISSIRPECLLTRHNLSHFTAKILRSENIITSIFSLAHLSQV